MRLLMCMQKWRNSKKNKYNFKSIDENNLKYKCYILGKILMLL